MKFYVHELYKSENTRVESPSQCIYCGDKKSDLRDEHVIPYALAANAMILEKSCCEACQNIIQRYEQEVLKKAAGHIPGSGGCAHALESEGSDNAHRCAVYGNR